MDVPSMDQNTMFIYGSIALIYSDQDRHICYQDRIAYVLKRYILIRIVYVYVYLFCPMALILIMRTKHVRNVIKMYCIM